MSRSGNALLSDDIAVYGEFTAGDRAILKDVRAGRRSILFDCGVRIADDARPSNIQRATVVEDAANAVMRLVAIARIHRNIGVEHGYGVCAVPESTAFLRGAVSSELAVPNHHGAGAGHMQAAAAFRFRRGIHWRYTYCAGSAPRQAERQEAVSRDTIEELDQLQPSAKLFPGP